MSTGPHLLVRLALLLACAGMASASDPVKVRLEFAPAAIAPGETAEGRVVFEVQPGYHIYGTDELTSMPTAVRLTGPVDLILGDPKFPPARTAHLEALGGRVSLLEGTVVVTFSVSAAASARPGTAAIEAIVDYQPCTDRLCERPRQDVQVMGSLGVQPAGSAAPTGVEDKTTRPVQASAVGPAKPPEPGPAPSTASPSPPPAKKDPFKDALDQGLFWALLAAFGWGIAASFSPCVYPMIPITISYFGGQSREAGARKRVALAAAYVLGMTLTYAVLGIIAAKLGQDLGAWMVNPWVVGSLALMLVALACSMFGLYVLQFPPSLTNWLNSGDRGGYLEALFMGLALGFVAAPCVGPFAGSILVFVARSGSVLVGFATLFSFGMGMGVLFMALAISSGSLALLPRSGGWLLAVEHFFGYVLIGMALYLLSNLWPPAFTTWAIGVYLVCGGTYAGAFTPIAADAKGWNQLRRAAGIVLVVMGSTAVAAATAQSGLIGSWPATLGAGQNATAGDTGHSSWLRSLEEGFAEARRTGKPIFADFYADWCIPCKLMDRNVFPEPSVVAALEPFIRVKVDCTSPDSPGARYKNEQLGARNMPYLAFFDPSGKPLPVDSIEGYAEKEQLIAAAQAVATRFSPAAK